MSDNADQTSGAKPGDTGADSKHGSEPKFEAITSQEDFDRRLADRLRREREKYADYDDLKAKADKLAEIEEANKTEEQKQAERVAELEKKLSDYETREQLNAWKGEVATEKGVPAHLLRGSTREELAEHADEIKALLDEKPQPQRPNSNVSKTPPALNSTALEEALRRAVGAN